MELTHGLELEPEAPPSSAAIAPEHEADGGARFLPASTLRFGLDVAAVAHFRTRDQRPVKYDLVNVDVVVDAAAVSCRHTAHAKTWLRRSSACISMEF